MSLKPKDIPFEDAMKKLEDLVHQMEQGKLSLEDSVRVFEEGMALSRYCEKKLGEAEGKIEVLMKKATVSSLKTVGTLEDLEKVTGDDDEPF